MPEVLSRMVKGGYHIIEGTKFEVKKITLFFENMAKFMAEMSKKKKKLHFAEKGAILVESK